MRLSIKKVLDKMILIWYHFIGR